MQINIEAPMMIIAHNYNTHKKKIAKKIACTAALSGLMDHMTGE